MQSSVYIHLQNVALEIVEFILQDPTHFFLLFYSWYAREKKGREVPGPSKKVPGLLDLFSPGTTGPRDLQGL